MTKLKQIRVIAISGDSCANCYSVSKQIMSFKDTYKDVEFSSLEASENPAFISKYKVEYVPTILILKGEEEIARARGYQPEEILEIWLEDKIEKAREE